MLCAVLQTAYIMPTVATLATVLLHQSVSFFPP